MSLRWCDPMLLAAALVESAAGLVALWQAVGSAAGSVAGSAAALGEEVSADAGSIQIHTSIQSIHMQSIHVEIDSTGGFCSKWVRLQ